MLATYEKALREECGYTGGQPYVFFFSENLHLFYLHAYSNSVAISIAIGIGLSMPLKTLIAPPSMKQRSSTQRPALAETGTMSSQHQRRTRVISQAAQEVDA